MICVVTAFEFIRAFTTMAVDLLPVLRCYSCSYYASLDSSSAELSSDENCRDDPEDEEGMD